MSLSTLRPIASLHGLFGVPLKQPAKPAKQ
jgi:hypothetical protein